jgi:DHA2 family multidrug resistance protein
MSAQTGPLAHVSRLLENLLFQHGDAATAAKHGALAEIYVQIVRQAQVMSYLDGFRAMALLFLIAVPLVWLMRKPHYHDSAASE